MASRKLRLLTLSGMLAAVGFVLELFEFPLLPAAPFLKFDFGDVAVFVAGASMGPGAALLTGVTKGVLWGLVGHGADGWVGALMNTVAVVTFALPAAFACRSTALRTRVLSAVLGIAAMTASMLAMNLIVDPLYFKLPMEAIRAMLPVILVFNLIRGSINAVASVGVLMLLKRTPAFRPYLST
ncbi:MAG TPA: ECF transporter S component [Candidatus Cryosericum sp.]|mgnify:CR=1 FL=1|nr:ECF transporter S component [Candidatus Cryosericum sp.]HPS69904.1 ECF transporter S component [Candidatus Cryosericum sp.]